MPLGTLIRKVKTVDREQVLALLEAAFGQEDEGKIVEHLWRENAVTIERVAEHGGVVVGYIAYTNVQTDPAIDGPQLGLAPLAVAPAHQQQGFGSALVEETLSVCRDMGANLIVVLGEPSYYGRFGFEPASSRNMRWDALDAGDAFQMIAGDMIKGDAARIVQYHPAFYAES